MLLAVIILLTAAVVLLFLLMLQRREIRDISSQLREVKGLDTNELIHTLSGDKSCLELIEEINSLLRETRGNRIDYARKNHELEQMMTNISHDLRTPLTSAMGYIHMIRTLDLPQAEKEREIEIVEKRLLRLEELLNSFFEFSRIISGEEKPELEEMNLVAALEEAVAHYYDDYSERGREILLCCDVPKYKILSNRSMLMRIFDNLIGNALKHGEGNLTVTLESLDSARIRFENRVTDPDLDVDHVFDEFYTTDISRTKGNTGLGLAIAKQFTHMLGGEISAEHVGGLFSVMIDLNR